MRISENKNKIIKYMPEFILVLIFMSGRTNIPLSNINYPIYVSLIGIFSLIIFLLVKKKRFKIPLNYFFIMNFFFIFLLIFSLFLYHSNYSFSKVFEFLFYTMLTSILIYNIINNAHSLKYISKFFYIISFLFAFFGIIKGIISGDLFSGRLSLIGGPNTYGRILVYGILCLLILVLNKQLSRIHLISLPFFLVAIILSGARQAIIGGFIAFLICLFLYFVLQDSKKKFKTTLYIFIIFILCFLPIYFVSSYITNTNSYQRIMMLFNEDKGSSVITRLWLIQEGFEYINKNFLIGYGIGAFEYYFPFYRYPHNIFVEIWFELGIFGIVCFLFFFIYSLWTAFRALFKTNHFLKRSYLTLYISMIMFSFFTAQISGDIFDNRWIWYFSTILLKLKHINFSKKE
jgi:O-antigen ligase